MGEASMNRLPLLRTAALVTTSIVAVNVGYTKEDQNRALFIAGRDLGLFRK